MKKTEETLPLAQSSESIEQNWNRKLTPGCQTVDEHVEITASLIIEVLGSNDDKSVPGLDEMKGESSLLD